MRALHPELLDLGLDLEQRVISPLPRNPRAPADAHPLGVDLHADRCPANARDGGPRLRRGHDRYVDVGVERPIGVGTPRRRKLEERLPCRRYLPTAAPLRALPARGREHTETDHER
jgi:hypothetical protein